MISLSTLRVKRHATPMLQRHVSPAVAKETGRGIFFFCCRRPLRRKELFYRRKGGPIPTSHFNQPSARVAPWRSFGFPFWYHKGSWPVGERFPFNPSPKKAVQSLAEFCFHVICFFIFPFKQKKQRHTNALFFWWHMFFFVSSPPAPWKATPKRIPKRLTRLPGVPRPFRGGLFARLDARGGWQETKAKAVQGSEALDSAKKAPSESSDSSTSAVMQTTRFFFLLFAGQKKTPICLTIFGRVVLCQCLGPHSSPPFCFSWIVSTCWNEQFWGFP